MKDLFLPDTRQLTPEAIDLSDRISKSLEEFFLEAEQKDYCPKQVAYMICSSATFLASKYQMHLIIKKGKK